MTTTPTNRSAPPATGTPSAVSAPAAVSVPAVVGASAAVSVPTSASPRPAERRAGSSGRGVLGAVPVHTAHGASGRGARSTVTQPASASAAIADVLSGPSRPVEVLAVFPAAVYLAYADGVVTLVTADGVAHPNALVLTARMSDRPFAGLHRGQHGTVGRAVASAASTGGSAAGAASGRAASGRAASGGALGTASGTGGGGAVRIGRLEVGVTRWFDPVPTLRPVTSALLARQAGELRRALRAASRNAGALPLPRDLDAALASVSAALLVDDVDGALAASHRLIGAGPGLTPTGDDLLAGLLAAVVTLAPVMSLPAPGGIADGAREAAPRIVADGVREAAPRIVARARYATTAISAELLRHAARGEVAAPAADVLHALTGGRPLSRAVEALLAVGATSGRDLAHGLLAGADLVLASAADVPSRAAVRTASSSVLTTSPSEPAGDVR